MIAVDHPPFQGNILPSSNVPPQTKHVYHHLGYVRLAWSPSLDIHDGDIYVLLHYQIRLAADRSTCAVHPGLVLFLHPDSIAMLFQSLTGLPQQLAVLHFPSDIIKISVRPGPRVALVVGLEPCPPLAPIVPGQQSAEHVTQIYGFDSLGFAISFLPAVHGSNIETILFRPEKVFWHVCSRFALGHSWSVWPLLFGG